MTCFENLFLAIKKILKLEGSYDIWPDFVPRYEFDEFTIATVKGVGNVLILNCGNCDGPSDVRHHICRDCVKKRVSYAFDVYTHKIGVKKRPWNVILLSRTVTNGEFHVT
ncbi:hypothetical protein B6U74_00275 [Candidatus Bathyarchaeota archaeon ex4484_205]|nr:MAG: hypothetical protein B6U74_00275 [Candidatus Bathyarchaeota archaeon ex4484_205]RLG69440.1 MAG: hypothetical protein DRN93_00015 [archaeon]